MAGAEGTNHPAQQDGSLDLGEGKRVNFARDIVGDIFTPEVDRLQEALKYLDDKKHEEQENGLKTFLRTCGDSLFKVPISEIGGIYFLLQNYVVVYVGQSKNIYLRISSHIAQGEKKFDYACAIKCEESQRDALEAAFMGLLKPKYNAEKGFCCNDREAFIHFRQTLKIIGLSKQGENGEN